MRRTPRAASGVQHIHLQRPVVARRADVIGSTGRCRAVIAAPSRTARFRRSRDGTTVAPIGAAIVRMTPQHLLRNVPRKVPTAKTGKRYLVVGGHGFLGSHIVEALLARGEDRIRVLDIAPSPLFAGEIEARRVEFVRA